MKQYLELLEKIMAEGHDKPNRTGTATRSIFGAQMRFDLTQGFPMVTTKKLYMRAVIHELLWFIAGSTNTKYLKENNVTIWDEWADEDGNLGPIYGKQWRSWHKYHRGHHHTVDQLGGAIKTLQDNPEDRRIIVSAWNVSDIPDMALPPCHLLFQFYSREMTVAEMVTEYAMRSESGEQLLPAGQADTALREDLKVALKEESIPTRYLSVQMYQRSADMFLGVPFNIASYSLLLEMAAKITNHIPKDYVHTLGDAHVYHNHFEQVRTQLGRHPAKLPTLDLLGQQESIDDFTFDDVVVMDYNPHGALKGRVAV